MTWRGWPKSSRASSSGPYRPERCIGIHCGPVVFQDGDIYGSTVNVAARLSARAGPGEVLVSKPVADRISHPRRLEPVGAIELKGVAHSLEVWRCPPGPPPG
jgi:class 3 adenylate cyclase